MPSFKTMRRINNYSSTIGQRLKEESDDKINQTWENDIQTKECYIYDYYHDNTKEFCSGYIPNEESGKKKVSLKFIVKEYKSASKDDPEYHIQFKPEDWNSMSCQPDWFYENYGKYQINFPIGLFVDVPDDRGVYHKWIIFYEEEANQFKKFGVFRCNYRFRWITDKGNERYKRDMWGVQRIQNSYNSGIYTYDKTTKIENQSKFWLPWNEISSELYYDQRIIISMPIEKPITYKISKVENTVPKGINEFTIYQDTFNEHTDYVDLETGIMYADYYKKPIVPTEEQNKPTDKSYVKLSCNLSQIKISGGFKTITSNYFDDSGKEILLNQSDYIWSFFIEGKDVSSMVEISYRKEPNKIGLKFTGDETYLDKVLVVKCEVKAVSCEKELNIIAL